MHKVKNPKNGAPVDALNAGERLVLPVGKSTKFSALNASWLLRTYSFLEGDRERLGVLERVIETRP